MCQTCGCGVVKGFAVDGVPASGRTDSGHPHTHDHVHDQDEHHDHPHPHSHPHAIGGNGAGVPQTVDVNLSLLSKNDRLAERNRGYFKAMGVLVLNVLSSPGSGKTALIERTVRDLAGRVRVGVIVGDLATDNDARRLREAGAPAVQVTTGDVCHLDAEMVARAAERLDLRALDVLIIENVGNLVCPADFDLGEDFRVVLASVTEGEDKPLKYPTVYRTARVVALNKIDLAEATGFDRETALRNLRRAAPGATVLEVSARTGQGMEAWYAWLEGLRSTGA